MEKLSCFVLKDLLKNDILQYLIEINRKGVEEIDIFTLDYISYMLKEICDIDFFKLLSKEEKKTLEKRGCVILASFDGEREEIYPPKSIIYNYENLHYNKEVLIDSMKLDGATPMEQDNELAKLDTFLRENYSNFTDEQYQRAKTYLEMEEFIDSCKFDKTLSTKKRINTISNLVDHTLAISSKENKNIMFQKSQKKR